MENIVKLMKHGESMKQILLYAKDAKIKSILYIPLINFRTSLHYFRKQ